MRPIHIVVPGAIVAWQRPQQRRFKTGAHVTFTRPDVRAYHAVARMAAEEAMGGRPPLEGPLELSLLAVFAVPDGWSAKKRRDALAGIVPKLTRPDLDNSIRGAIDAIQSVVFHDDKQIVSYAACSKIYGERPRLEIVVSPIEPVTREVAVGKPIAAVADLFAGAGA